MAKTQGKDILVYINTGTPEMPTWTLVGGQKNASMSFSQGSIETTDKDSAGWKERELGNREVKVDFDAFLIEDDSGWAELKKGLVGASHQKCHLKLETASYEYIGNFVMEDLTIDGPNEDMGTVSFSLVSDGEVTETAKA